MVFALLLDTLLHSQFYCNNPSTHVTKLIFKKRLSEAKTLRTFLEIPAPLLLSVFPPYNTFKYSRSDQHICSCCCPQERGR